MRSISKHSDKETFWKEQLRLFTRFKGSQATFCRLHGLSTSTFQYWHRKHFQRERALQIIEPSPFIEVKVEPEVPRSRHNMPDAKWVAELILHLQGGLR